MQEDLLERVKREKTAKRERVLNGCHPPQLSSPMMNESSSPSY